MKGQAINIDWTVGLSLFLLTALSSVFVISQPNTILSSSQGIQNQLLEVSSQLEEETYIEGRKTKLYVRSPIEIDSKIPVDREYIFEEFAAGGSGSINTSSQIEVNENRFRALADGENTSYQMIYLGNNISSKSYSNDINTGINSISNSHLELETGDPGITSITVNENQLLKDSAQLSYTNYTVNEEELYAYSFEENLKVYDESPEFIIENPGTAVFNLTQLEKLYWYADNSTSNFYTEDVSRSGNTQGFTVAGGHGITFIGDLDVDLDEINNNTVEAEITSERLRILVHDSNYWTGKERIEFYDRGEIYFGSSRMIEGATRDELQQISSLSQPEFEETLNLGNLGYNITYGIESATGITDKLELSISSFLEWSSGDFDGTTAKTIGTGGESDILLEQILNSQGDFNQGSFDGTSADRAANSGDLGIGYLNGTRSGQPYDNGLNGKSLVGYWRMDSTSDPLPGSYNVKDYSGEELNGTTQDGLIRGGRGVMGTNAFMFDGSNGIEMSDRSTSRLEGMNGITISVWYKATADPTDRNLVSKYWDGSDRGYYLNTRNGVLTFLLATDQQNQNNRIDSSFTPEQGEWYHAAATWSSSTDTMRLYSNGSSIGTETSTGDAVRENTDPLTIGDQTNFYNAWSGLIDEVRIYNRSLSSGEIKDLYFEGRDSTFNGNYTAKEIENSQSTNWNKLEIDANVPSDTSLTANFSALDKDGSLLETDIIRVLGEETLEQSVTSRSELKLGEFNGTSADRSDNSGTLGIGYLNGTESGQPNSNALNNASLAGYWRLDRSVQGSGGNIVDYSGGGNDGTTTNGVSTGEKGVFGTNSTNFDDSDTEYIDGDSTVSLDNTDGGLSMSAWIKPDTDTTSTDGQAIFRWAAGSSDNTGFGLGDPHGGAGDLNFEWSDGGLTYDIPDNWQREWKHLVFVADDQDPVTMRIYVDGKLVKTGGVSGSQTVTGDGEWEIGYNGFNTRAPYDGSVDELRVYDRDLSNSSIRKLYFNGREGKFNGDYTAKKIDNSQSTDWNKLEIDANVPSDTSLTANFSALDTNGNIVETQTISVNDGVQNYTLTVSGSEDARLKFNGTSRNESQSWELSDFRVYRSPPGNYTLSVQDSENARLKFNGTSTNPTKTWSVSGTQVYSEESNLGSEQQISTQQDYNEGDFSGTSTDRKDNSGDLGIGYLNGTKSGQTDENGLNGNSLIGYWRLDEDGGTVTDYSGEGNDGTKNNGVTHTTGVFGTDGLKFDYSNDEYVSHNVDESKFSDEATISLWLKRKELNTPSGRSKTGIFHYGTGTRSHYPWQNGNLYITTFADSRIIDGLDNTGFDKTRWHHLLITTSPGTDNYRLYQNSNPVASRDGPSTVTLPSNTRFGWSDNSYYFNGKMDEIRLYNRSVNESEVERLYFQGMNDVFNGNYTAKEIDNSQSTNWNKLEIDANIPDDTSLTAKFKALDSNSNPQEEQLISVEDGLQNYTLNVQNTENAEVKLNGTSTNVTETWEVSEIEVYSQQTETEKEGSLRIGYRDGSTDTQLTDGLVGYWRMDEDVAGDGGTFKDYSGQENDGITENNLNTGQNGIFSTNSSKFEPTAGSQIRINDTDIVTSDSDDVFTVSAWINTEDTDDYDGILTFTRYTGVFLCSDGGFSVQSRGDNAGTCPSMSAVNDGEWHHLVGTYIEGERYLGYRDGNQVFNVSTSDDAGENSDDTIIGVRQGADDHFSGKMDEVRIYNRSLSEEEVDRLYFNGREGVFNGEYTADRLEYQNEKNWSQLEVNADIPSETDLSAEIVLTNEFGNQLGTKLISIEDGLNNYTLDVDNSEELLLSFNGTSENVTKTWKVKDFTIYSQGEETPPLVRRGRPIPFEDSFVLDSESTLIRENGSIGSIQNQVVLWQ